MLAAECHPVMRALKRRHPENYKHIVTGKSFTEVYQPLLDDAMFNKG